MSDCEKKSCCEEASGHDKEAQKSHAEGSLVEQMTHWWKSAGCKAWQEVVTEILKEKIRAAYGAHLEKGAEAFVAAEGARWQAKVAQAKAAAEFRKAIEKEVLG
ncbi:conserved protein of unknown function [Methylacidimicrobium sp. AP8]|uniref:hypothetical protein n=1 Tax=Methylacidimicrobium sp. AP8 TaxID=2730359 RepID=UPI0018C0B138|nr:hypothetical protein [Methylacidimicrobium sp. AP8]CAB4243676.1 conserved protein of unknown function [Methylacidimicrobium sp. AP8]